MYFKTTLLGLFIFSIFLIACKKWDDHTALKDQNLNLNLLQAVSERPNLSKFYEYLQKTGLDKELSSSKTYTVWAPTNDALQNLDPAIAADSARLRKLIANHIAFQQFFTRDVPLAEGMRIPMLSGKRIGFLKNKFDDASIIESDKFVNNGVLHLVDKIAPVLSNAWELVNETKTAFLQSAFITSLNFNGFDPSTAIIDSINAVTGQPIYRPGTGVIARNRFNDQVYDLKNEQKQYTYFILNNTGFNVEVNKLKPYYATGTADSTTNLSSFAVVKDLLVDSLMLNPAQWPDTLRLISKFGVTIPIEKSKIVETRKMSNGIAYVMSSVNFSAKSKIPTIINQGRNPSAFFRPTGELVDVRNATFYRARTHPVTGQLFNDIFLYNHGVASLNIQYQSQNTPSVKYKVSWVAVNDTLTVDRGNRINPVVFSQRLAMGSRTSTSFALIAVNPNNYNEVSLGEYTQTGYGDLNMFLTAANSGTAGVNSLSLYYIKLVPDIQ